MFLLKILFYRIQNLLLHIPFSYPSSYSCRLIAVFLLVRSSPPSWTTRGTGTTPTQHREKISMEHTYMEFSQFSSANLPEYFTYFHSFCTSPHSPRCLPQIGDRFKHFCTRKRRKCCNIPLEENFHWVTFWLETRLDSRRDGKMCNGCRAPWWRLAAFISTTSLHPTQSRANIHDPNTAEEESGEISAIGRGVCVSCAFQKHMALLTNNKHVCGNSW